MSEASLGIAPIALIASLVFAGATVSNVLVNTQTTASNSYQKLVNDVTTDMTTSFNVDQVIGKYNMSLTPPGIDHIAIHLRPLTACAIDLTKLKIELITPTDLVFLPYQDTGKADPTGALFSNTLWKTLKTGSFTMLITNDDDSSVDTSHTLNKNTDAGFILITLPKTSTLTYPNSYQIGLIPTPGQTEWITLDVPYASNTPLILYG